MTPQIQHLPSDEFDCGTTTAAPNVLACMKHIQADAKAAGLDVLGLCRQAKRASADEAPRLLEQLHETAVILFLQWQRATQLKEEGHVLAFARLLNGVTRDARLLNERFELIPTDHIQQLERDLKEIKYDAEFDPRHVAAAMEKASRQHVHERAWPWVVLPTFPRQQYGRILLLKVDLPGITNPLVVTQPFFLERRSTLFHTHGQNWAFSRPLGPNDSANKHLNSLWVPKTPEQPFPLTLLELAEYTNDMVAIVPPRVIHGISRRSCHNMTIPPLKELIQGRKDIYQQLIANSRFGEMSCMHIYCPDKPLADKFEDCPYVQAEEEFFIEYDMIVFDHYAESVWSGGGGSWPKRMIEFGTTGDHCGICFNEDDPRKEGLDPTTVSEWFIKYPPPKIIQYSN